MIYITTLNLAHNALNKTTPETPILTFKNLPELAHLDLSNNTRHNQKILDCIFNDLPKLSTLSLDYSVITTACRDSLMQSLPQSTNLIKVNLTSPDSSPVFIKFLQERGLDVPH